MLTLQRLPQSDLGPAVASLAIIIATVKDTCTALLYRFVCLTVTLACLIMLLMLEGLFQKQYSYKKTMSKSYISLKPRKAQENYNWCICCDVVRKFVLCNANANKVY